MEKDTEVLMTIKQWAEKAGLKLYNYDGFVEIYEKLSGNSSLEFYDNLINRFDNAGDLICTRKAFESGLSRCTMKFPETSEYVEMSNVIPEFVESSINMKIACINGTLKHTQVKQEDTREKVEELLALMKQKKVIREKSIRMNEPGEAKISTLNTRWYNEEELKIVNTYEGTVEGLEEKLSSEIIARLEKSLESRSIQLSELPLDEISTLGSILYGTVRQKIGPEIEEEFINLNFPGQKKEPFVRPYTIYGEEEERTGVAFDIQTEDGNVKGAMPTTPEMDWKIRNKNQKIIDSRLSIEDSNKALQVIDKSVTPEQRKTFVTRMKQFARNILDKITGKNKKEQEREGKDD